MLGKCVLHGDFKESPDQPLGPIQSFTTERRAGGSIILLLDLLTYVKEGDDYVLEI